MSEIPHFHGSDIEAIEAYYGIPKETIIGFGANVNPLGLSQKLQTEIANNLHIITNPIQLNIPQYIIIITLACINFHIIFIISSIQQQ
jgi:histidinol-phosphate/aromatic aminotransferase/cobyric acid decarboxylase-like protein